jgi:hypothetical protein
VRLSVLVEFRDMDLTCSLSFSLARNSDPTVNLLCAARKRLHVSGLANAAVESGGKGELIYCLIIVYNQIHQDIVC